VLNFKSFILSVLTELTKAGKVDSVMLETTVDETERQIMLKRLVEDVGIIFEDMALPRMAGRMLGWLLICDPPHQSSAELCAAIGGSKGSISSMARLLIQAGLVERMGVPGDRIIYYRIKPGAWFELMRNRIAHLTVMRRLAERGLELMAGLDAQTKNRLEEIHDFYAFFEQEMPLLLERWQRQRNEAGLNRESTQTELQETGSELK